MPLFGRGRAEEAAGATVTCPSCHEPVSAGVLVCPHCKGVLPPRAQGPAVGATGPAGASSTSNDEQAAGPTQ
jgi:hypothetical protein